MLAHLQITMNLQRFKYFGTDDLLSKKINVIMNQR